MRRTPSYIQFVVLILFLPAVSSAQQYPLGTVNVLGSGGGSSSDGSRVLHDTIGESFGGEVVNSSYGIKAGFWYAVDQIHIGPTSAVVITNFDVEYTVDGIVVKWSIREADGLIGFNVYRSSGNLGAFVRINVDVIPGEKGREYMDKSVQPGNHYYYRLGAIDRDGEFLSVIAEVRVPLGEVTLYQNYPNPFNPSTTISFYLPKPSHTILTIFDSEGRLVAEVLDEPMSFGKHEILWDGRNNQGHRVSTGVYFYKFQAGKKVITKKLTVLK